ncbi:MAG: hypothetical protein RL190_1488 [Actinomycetota bacterium]|jgi:hypothetical protein
MSDTPSIADRMRELIEHEPPGDGRVRNHLSVTGSPAAMRGFIEDCRTNGGARILTIGDQAMPIRWERHAARSTSGTWVRIDPGREPLEGSEHEEGARAEFAFGSDAPLDEALGETSRRHPDLEFRYAGLRHHRLRYDVARGGLWKGGERVAEAEEPATTHHEEGEQMATLIRDVEALEVPHAA